MVRSTIAGGKEMSGKDGRKYFEALIERYL